MVVATGRVAAVALLAIAAASAAPADHLVTRDGQVIETRGGWEIRDRLLVFRLADGTLASMRLEEADLEASEERTREAARLRSEATKESPQPPPQPVEASFVITDRDVLHILNLGQEPTPEDDEGAAAVVADASGQAAAGDDVAGGDTATAGAEAAGGDDPFAASIGGVQVVQWSQEPEGETGMAVRGVIENLGSSFATRLSVNAMFYDQTGDLIAARDVELEDGPLGPAEQREFSVSVPDTLIYDEIKFLVVGRGFRPVGQSVRTGPPLQ